MSPSFPTLLASHSGIEPGGSAGGSGATPPPMSPGDEAPAGTPGTGENVCRQCGGSGQLAEQPCPECDGTGKVITGIGGA